MTNIALDGSYSNMWANILSIKRGLIERYQFSDDMKITRVTISRDIGKIDPGIDNLNAKYQSGIYRGVRSAKKSGPSC